MKDKKEVLVSRPTYEERITPFIDKDFVKIVVGIRRSGKTEILNLIKNRILKNTDNSHIIHMNFEKSEFFDIKNYRDLASYVENKMTDDKTYYIFFDEIQEVEGWEKAVNSLRLMNTDIYITGSNSKLLAGEFATLLGGRVITLDMYPLSFEEFILFRKTNGFGSEDLDKELEAYIKFGGFPAVSMYDYSQKEAMHIVSDIHSTALLRDVIRRNPIKNPQLMDKIVSFLYDNIGSLVSIRSISGYLQGEGRRGTDVETIANYIKYLEEGFLIKKAQRYDIKGKKLLETNDKYYLTDHSLQYAVRDFKQDNIQDILENIVFMDLIRRGYNVFVGKFNDKEIDFVAEKNNDEKVYIQVSYALLTAETYSREYKPLKEIKDSFPKYVVLLRPDNIITNDEGVVGILLKDFLLKKDL